MYIVQHFNQFPLMTQHIYMYNINCATDHQLFTWLDQDVSKNLEFSKEMKERRHLRRRVE